MHRYLPLLLVVGLLIVFRGLGSAFSESMPNFQPLAAVFFCGALLAPGWLGFMIPFAAWAITFPLGVGHTSSPSLFATTLLAFIAIYFLGKKFTGKSLPVLLLGSVAASLIFHFITNGAAWIADPMYAKTTTGLWQSLWTGPVSSSIPSWVFLRNFTAANVLFTSLIALAQFRMPSFAGASQETAPVKLP